MLNWDKQKTRLWNANRLFKKDPRVEIRGIVNGTDLSISGSTAAMSLPYRNPAQHNVSSNILIVIRPNDTITISSNGRLVLTTAAWTEMQEAITEGKEALALPEDAFKVWRALRQ